MIDLEHLDAFDDDAPPSPDLGQVRHRAGRLRTRNRLAAIGTCVAVLAVAVGVVAVVRDRDHSVEVVGPSGATAAPTTPEDHPTVTGTLRNGLPIEMTLDTPTVLLGSNIEATVVVRNNTGEAKTLGTDPIQCALSVGPVLHDADGHVVVSEEENGTPCYDVGVALPAGGARTIRVALPTTSVEMPPRQREGAYELTLEAHAWRLPPLPVTLVLPDLSAHLELPQTTYPAGYSLEGTIVFDNRQGEPIDYRISCAKERPWIVLLSKDGVVFEIAHATGACRGPGTTDALAPGTSRVPFYVGLTYSGCGTQPEGPAFPACTGNPPGIPELAPGHYQMVFRGGGAPFKALDVAPLDITVTARSGGAP